MAENQGKNESFDSDGYSNYEEFINDTDPEDSSSYPSPPEILDSVPHHRAGNGDALRVPNNASFGVYIVDAAGIDLDQNDSVTLTVDDQVHAAYAVNVGDIQNGIARSVIISGNGNSEVYALWFVYDRSLDQYGDFPFDRIVEISVAVVNKNGHRATQNFNFRVETETEHNNAIIDPSIPDYSAIEVDDSPYNAGYQINSGVLDGARILYNSDTEPHEDLRPRFAPTDGIPEFRDSGNIIGVGDLVNVQPPIIFSTPVKLFVPIQGNSASKIQIWIYNGEWTLACDTDGSSDLPGWMVAGSRVNSASGIELKVYHFSGVHAAVVTSPIPPSGDDDDDDTPEDDTATCFIQVLWVR